MVWNLRDENPPAPSLVDFETKIREYFKERRVPLKKGETKRYFKGGNAASADSKLLLSEMFKARKSKGRELDFAKLKKPGIYYFNLRGVVRFPDPPKTTIRCHYVGLSRNVYLRIKGHIQKKNELIRINEQLITCERELTKVTKKFYAIVKQLARLPSTSNKQRREHIKQKNKLNVKLAALCKERKNLEKKRKKSV